MKKKFLPPCIPRVLSLTVPIVVFLHATTFAQIRIEDNFLTLKNWRIFDLSGKGVLQIVEDRSVPPGYGPQVWTYVRIIPCCW